MVLFQLGTHVMCVVTRTYYPKTLDSTDALGTGLYEIVKFLLSCMCPLITSAYRKKHAELGLREKGDWWKRSITNEEIEKKHNPCSMGSPDGVTPCYDTNLWHNGKQSAHLALANNVVYLHLGAEAVHHPSPFRLPQPEISK